MKANDEPVLVRNVKVRGSNAANAAKEAAKDEGTSAPQRKKNE